MDDAEGRAAERGIVDEGSLGWSEAHPCLRQAECRAKWVIPTGLIEAEEPRGEPGPSTNPRARPARPTRLDLRTASRTSSPAHHRVHHTPPSSPCSPLTHDAGASAPGRPFRHLACGRRGDAWGRSGAAGAATSRHRRQIRLEHVQGEQCVVRRARGACRTGGAAERCGRAERSLLDKMKRMHLDVREEEVGCCCVPHSDARELKIY